MKTYRLYGAAILASLWAVPTADAEPQIEIHAIELLGVQASEKEIVRMLDAGLLADPAALSGEVGADGCFTVDKTESFRYGVEFDDDGNVLRQRVKPLGRTLIGTVKRSGSLYEVALKYSEAAKIGDEVSMTKSGVAITQPAFTSTRFSCTFTAKPGQWVLLTLSSDNNTKRYLAARVKPALAGEQDGAAQPATALESKPEGEKPKSESERPSQ